MQRVLSLVVYEEHGPLFLWARDLLFCHMVLRSGISRLSPCAMCTKYASDSRMPAELQKICHAPPQPMAWYAAWTPRAEREGAHQHVKLPNSAHLRPCHVSCHV